jgi:hypothetical protein
MSTSPVAILIASRAPTVRFSSARSDRIRPNRQPRSAETTSSRSASRVMNALVPPLIPAKAASNSVTVWVRIERWPASIRATSVATPGRGRK